MNTVHWVWGYFGNDAAQAETAFQTLSGQYLAFAKAHIDPAIKVEFYRYTDTPGEIANDIIAAGGPVVLVGFSFGGHTANLVAQALQAKGVSVDFMLLHDPVKWLAPGVGLNTQNTNDFILPTNVKQAYCYYRNAVASPWSAPIRNATNIVPYTNFYRPDQNHGDSVWTGESGDTLKKGLYLAPISPNIVAPVVVKPVAPLDGQTITIGGFSYQLKGV